DLQEDVHPLAFPAGSGPIREANANRNAATPERHGRSERGVVVLGHIVWISARGTRPRKRKGLDPLPGDFDLRELVPGPPLCPAPSAPMVVSGRRMKSSKLSSVVLHSPPTLNPLSRPASSSATTAAGVVNRSSAARGIVSTIGNS